MCKIISRLTKKFIKWPTEISRVQKFVTLRGSGSFPSVIGCLDGTHIPISAPRQDPASHYNRKGFYSLQLQAIVDADLLFTDVFFGWPGSSHDSHIFKNSPIYCSLIEGRFELFGRHILADSAYPLMPFLMTPYRDNGFLSRQQKKYNYIHSSSRICVEQAFGLLKRKFRILQHFEIRNIRNAKYIVMACVVLHNFIRIND